MKLLAFFLVFLSSATGYSQDLKVFFIANDSVSIKEEFIFSRVLITSKIKFNYPADLKLNVDSIHSNFGVVEFETYDSVKHNFISFIPQMLQYFYPYDLNTKLNLGSKLNFSFTLLPRPAFKHGLYRSRVKIYFSRYNTGMRDATSNWSYFYIN